MEIDAAHTHPARSARARAVQRARRVLDECAAAPAPCADAREAAFADYAPRPVRTHQRHPTPAPSARRERSSSTATKLAAQLRQLEAQRRRLSALFEQLDPRR